MEIRLIIHALKAKQTRLFEKHFVKVKSQPHISKLRGFDTLVQWSCKTFRSQRNSVLSLYQLLHPHLVHTEMFRNINLCQQK